MKSRSDIELLAELEKECSELQTTIAVLKRKLGQPANDATSWSKNGASMFAVGLGGTTSDSDSDSKPYMGMNIPDAAKKYLQRVREPKSPQEIAEALRQGGLHSRSVDFMGVIRTTLVRNGRTVGIESYGGGKWGLSDWRPSRAKASQADEAQGT
jgi:hypothetical protein